MSINNFHSHIGMKDSLSTICKDCLALKHKIEYIPKPIKEKKQDPKIKTTTYPTNVTADNTAEVYYNVGTAGNTTTLPAASGVTNRRYIIVNRTAGAAGISNFIALNGVTSSAIAANSSIEIISDGTNWLQIK